MAKLRDNPDLLRRCAELMSAMRAELGWSEELKTFDMAYPLQSASHMHLELLKRGNIPDVIEEAFAALMCDVTELEWVSEMIPPAAQTPMIMAAYTHKYKTIGDIMERYGMTISDISNRFNIPYHTVQNWCAGRRSTPDYFVAMMDEALERDARDRCPVNG